MAPVPRSAIESGAVGPATPKPAAESSEDRRPASFSARVRALVRAIEENDEAKVEEAILRLSRSRRVFAPLGFTVGAFVMLYDGLRLLASNWRLTLVQILPAMWIWVAMLDLKAHTLHGKSFDVLRGPVLIPIGLVIVALTVASYFLNAVFAFSISEPGHVEIRPAIARARRHCVPIIVSGATTGALLAFSTTVVTRWGRPWFTLSLGIIVGVMMVSYVAVPARLIGAAKRTRSTRDKLSTSAVGGDATAVGPPMTIRLHARRHLVRRRVRRPVLRREVARSGSRNRWCLVPSRRCNPTLLRLAVPRRRSASETNRADARRRCCGHHSRSSDDGGAYKLLSGVPDGHAAACRGPPTRWLCAEASRRSDARPGVALRSGPGSGCRRSPAADGRGAGAARLRTLPSSHWFPLLQPRQPAPATYIVGSCCRDPSRVFASHHRNLRDA